MAKNISRKTIKMDTIKRIALILLTLCFTFSTASFAIEEVGANTEVNEETASAGNFETDIKAESLPENKDNKYVERALRHNKDYKKLKGSIELRKQADKKLISKISFDDIEAVAGEKVAKNIINAVRGNVHIHSGGGGVYGKISL